MFFYIHSLAQRTNQETSTPSKFDFVFLCHDSAVSERAHTALAAPSVPPIWGGCNRSSCRSHFGILDPSKGRDRFVMLPRWMQNPSILDIETFCWMGDLHALEVVEDMFLGGGLGFECFDGSGDFGEFYP